MPPKPFKKAMLPASPLGLIEHDQAHQSPPSDNSTETDQYSNSLFYDPASDSDDDESEYFADVDSGPDHCAEFDNVADELAGFNIFNLNGQEESGNADEKETSKENQKPSNKNIVAFPKPKALQPHSQSPYLFSISSTKKRKPVMLAWQESKDPENNFTPRYEDDNTELKRQRCRDCHSRCVNSHNPVSLLY